MAGILIGAQTGEIALTTPTSKTLLQVVAASNHRAIVHSFTVSCKGTVATDTPLRLQVIVQTDAGTSTALTVNPIDSTINETVQTTARHTSTADPTDSTILFSTYVHPQRTITITGPWIVPGGTRLAVKAVTPGQNATVVAAFRGEE